MAGTRTKSLAIITGASVIASGMGWAGATLIADPGDAKRDDFERSTVTAPVESVVLESAVTTRGDVVQAQAVELNLSPSSESTMEGTPVITGPPPEVGDTLEEGDIVAEVSGRPILLIEGAVPTYRSLEPGMDGDDVAQLEAALEALGHSPGTIDGHYDTGTESAVAELYEHLGYAPVSSADDRRGELDAAEEKVSSAEDELASAKGLLEEAQEPPSDLEVKQAEVEVSRAERALEDAQESGDADAVDQARNDLEIAELALEELTGEPDTQELQDQVDDARETLQDSQSELSELRSETGIVVPRGEIVSIANLPRVVAEVSARIGGTPEPGAVVLEGTSALVESHVTAGEADLLSEGDEAELLDSTNGAQLQGRVSAIEPLADAPDSMEVTVEPSTAFGDDTSANVRVRIPVGSTDGEVLAVPISAVYTSGDGDTKVRVIAGSGDGARDVTVELGLSSEGMVEVSAGDGSLTVDDRVAVSQA
ncbi:peptidoglycan-binding protein [Haloglycomyces albus]|uniref:peptidoglycan-binding protein n=1 Tax=Haloglycomyces albus TaxID=526067 RepID=UPI00046CDDC5|nr:peptidoglycan-binding protein [Haloglycomyces albus]